MKAKIACSFSLFRHSKKSVTEGKPYLEEAKLPLHLSKYDIISNCKSWVHCVLSSRYLGCIPSAPLAAVNRSSPHIVNSEIKAIRRPVRCHFERTKQKGKACLGPSLRLALSVTSEPLFGLVLTGLLKSPCLSPQALQPSASRKARPDVATRGSPQLHV